MRTLFKAFGTVLWVVCMIALTPVIILAWVLVSLGLEVEIIIEGLHKNDDKE